MNYFKSIQKNELVVCTRRKRARCRLHYGTSVDQNNNDRCW